jgi:hypothetical protein
MTRSASRSTKARTNTARSRSSCAPTRAKASSISRLRPTISSTPSTGCAPAASSFQDTIDTYFDLIDKRLPGHGHDVEEMRKRRILIDGAPETGGGLLLQIFTENMVGPIFFEIIQRKGNDGFGEGNFKALFESLELDQMRRGVIPSGRPEPMPAGFGNRSSAVRECCPARLPVGRNSPAATGARALCRAAVAAPPSLRPGTRTGGAGSIGGCQVQRTTRFARWPTPGLRLRPLPTGC